MDPLTRRKILAASAAGRAFVPVAAMAQAAAVAADVGYVPQAMGHYVENIGTEPVRFLEMFTGPRYSDVSLSQWLALIPPSW
jgi:oxalate decarboxylase/phosphoglucose isomerase-like protein (cupin superfamily)